MTTTTFEGFAEACRTSGVNLNADLAAEPCASDPQCVQPDEYHGAVAKAAEMLAEDPSLELVDAPISDELFGDGKLTIAQVALRDVLNASLTRVTGAISGAAFFCRSTWRVDTCSRAEGYFGQTLQTIEEERQYIPGDLSTSYGWSIVIDQEKKLDPTILGLVKHHHQPSMLSLEEIVVNGIPYPAGSLFYIRTLHPIRRNGTERLIVSSERIAFVNFLRLSAYAHPVGERQIFQNTIDEAKDAASRKNVEMLTMGGIRRIVRKGIALSCEVDKASSRSGRSLYTDN